MEGPLFFDSIKNIKLMFFKYFFYNFDVLISKIKKYIIIFSIKNYFCKNTLHCNTKNIVRISYKVRN
jgi:hypothetical protein